MGQSSVGVGIVVLHDHDLLRRVGTPEINDEVDRLNETPTVNHLRVAIHVYPTVHREILLSQPE